MTHQTAEVQLVSRKEARKQQTKPKRARRVRNVRTPVTMIATIGLLATSVLPSYGFDPETTALSGLTRDNRLVQFSASSELKFIMAKSVSGNFFFMLDYLTIKFINQLVDRSIHIFIFRDCKNFTTI